MSTSKTANQTPILRVESLSASYRVDSTRISAVPDVSFELHPGETLALVGESGSGNTSIALAMLGLLPYNATVEKGAIEYQGAPLPLQDEDRLRALRGSEIAMIFQDAHAALTPHAARRRPGRRSLHRAQRRLQARGPRPRRRGARSLPSRPGGGRRLLLAPALRRDGPAGVMIAMATALRPRVIIADEPTASLDLAVRDIHALLPRGAARRPRDRGPVDHPRFRGRRPPGRPRRGRLRGRADRDGGTCAPSSGRPSSPYTYGLISSLPSLDRLRSRLAPMKGQPPDLASLPPECPFLARCNKATLTCRTERAPRLEEIEPGHLVACYHQIVTPPRE